MSLIVKWQRERIKEGKALGIAIKDLDLDDRCPILVFECDICGEPITDSATARVSSGGAKGGKLALGPFFYHAACTDSFRAQNRAAVCGFSEADLNDAMFYLLLRMNINLWHTVTHALAWDEMNSGRGDYPMREEDVPEDHIRKRLRRLGIEASPSAPEEVEAAREEARKAAAAWEEAWGSRRGRAE